ncbi:low molecular weight phosphatase family protein [Sinomonas sp. JGH33]|uniref:Low molecular weight phosphatase family protein n=1 Tax=Sinomonas terricola TaxID=3110330 RepID=A0ABU5TBD2_9MICC|nr:low molecular weight phosphatase family protein [Sinomonas sp. JGH33]MEA5456997.1 low molecular weight phosphatase family protein [Sinomonas sp. JGH33]
MVGVSFNVLVVCSGNLCRSPIAEQLLRARTAGHPVIVSSAGTVADDGAPMPEEAAMVSRRYGGEPSGHRSQLLTESHLRSADLVLTATRAHRGSVVQMLPRMSRKAFTISEFARLLGAVPEAERATLADTASVVDAARSLRGFVSPPDEPEHDDLEDPYRQPFEVYEAVGARLDAEIGIIASGLWPSEATLRAPDVRGARQ